MTVLASLADFRDVVIVIYGIIGIIFFFVAIVMIASFALALLIAHFWAATAPYPYAM